MRTDYSDAIDHPDQLPAGREQPQASVTIRASTFLADDAAVRELLIVETLVSLTDLFVGELETAELMHLVATRALALLDCAEAALLVVGPTGALQPMPCSSERGDVLARLQVHIRRGPIVECYQSRTPVISDDLSGDFQRWPVFAPAALHAGLGAVYAVPMRARTCTVGVLSLFRSSAGGFAEPDVRLAQGLADIAAAALLVHRVTQEAQDTIEQLQRALQSRVLIEQAKGLLAARVRVGLDTAFALLRGYARDRNRRLSDVATDLIEGRLDTAAFTVPPGRRGARRRSVRERGI